MLPEHKQNILTEFLNGLTPDELLWVNGYVNGIVSKSGNNEKPVQKANKKFTIAYGTETGNSKKLAVEFAAKAKKTGVQAKLVSLDQYRLNDLPKEEYFVTVISTQGDGEPPIAAQKFYDHLYNNGFKVPALKYAVLALGDTSYPMFCKTGEDVDAQLEKLGAERFYPLQKCDLDYEAEADKWFSDLLASINKNSAVELTVTAPILPVIKKKSPGKKIYSGKVLTNINLNARGSSFKTFHIELAAEDVEYFPGDSIGIIPKNDLLEVNEILALTGIEEDYRVTYKSEEGSLKYFLENKINIRFLLEKFVQQYGLLANESFAGRQDLLQLLRKNSIGRVQALEFILSLHAMAPRIYNIASAISAHGNEVHIIALKDEFLLDEKLHTGLCSSFLENKQEDDEVEFFIQTNKRFRLPAAEKDVIMIGPGTGVAPFRSFMAERDITGAAGRNWLFFGCEKFTTDFYYQTEWQNWFGTGVLTNISLAFSKDGPVEKRFADKLLENAKVLFEWIDNGAYVYLCGEKDPMGKEAESALISIIQTEGNLSPLDAQQYFEKLKTEGRFVKDLY